MVQKVRSLKKDKTMNDFTIGSLAKSANVNIETIRFYERKGIIPKPARKPSGFRLYSDTDLNRLNFIIMAKRHGFTLNEIKELLELRVHPQSTCDEVREKAEQKIKVIEEKLRELKRIKKALQTLAASCHGPHPGGDCPILDAFEQEN